MKNIEFKAVSKFGSTFAEKIDGRKLTRFVAKEAAKRNVSEHKVIRDFVETIFYKYHSNEEITSYEFTWLNQFNSKCTIAQSELEIIEGKEYTRQYRLIDKKYNYKDANGKTLFNEWFEWIGHFYDGYAVIEREGDYFSNFIDKNGKLLSEEWFDWADDFEDGFARVKRANGEQAKIDKTGKIVISK